MPDATDLDCSRVQIMTNSIEWPDNKTFAFTIFDDTDLATMHNVPPVYEFLSESGFRTTKSVWPSRGPNQAICGGATCEDPDYLKWVLQLQALGFEIGYHMNTFHQSQREETLKGLKRFTRIFGHSPYTMANHTGCNENIYWGQYRLSGKYRLLYNLLTRFKKTSTYRGHIEGDPLFWGDLCKENVKYCRNFVYPDINTLKACPQMPYHDPDRHYVNQWFASSEGPNVDSFILLLSEPNQDRLEREGGLSIVYSTLLAAFIKTVN